VTERSAFFATLRDITHLGPVTVWAVARPLQADVTECGVLVDFNTGIFAEGFDPFHERQRLFKVKLV
jgi:hypothetical protein